MNRTRLAAVAAIAFAAALLCGCSLFAVHRSIGLDAADVVTVEVYEYVWGAEPDTVPRLTIVNDGAREESVDEIIEEWVAAFTDMPTTRPGSSVAEEAEGKEALGVRFTLSDGSTVEITRIFIGYHDVVVIWPDGSVRRTTWGAPDLIDYYSEFVGVLEEADSGDIPGAALP